MSTNSDFEDLLSAFCAAGVRYLVVGGFAYAFHATPRYTKDIDLWIDATPQNAARVWRALTAFGAPLGKLGPADFEDRGRFFAFGRAPQRVDILTSLEGVEFAAAWRRRNTMTYGRVADVPVLSERDLIASKRAAGRTQDLADVEELERRARLRSEPDDGSGRVSERRPRKIRRGARPRRR